MRKKIFRPDTEIEPEKDGTYDVTFGLDEKKLGMEFDPGSTKVWAWVCALWIVSGQDGLCGHTP